MEKIQSGNKVVVKQPLVGDAYVQATVTKREVCFQFFGMHCDQDFKQADLVIICNSLIVVADAAIQEQKLLKKPLK